MGAIEHALTDPLPDRILLEADFLTVFFVPTNPYHEACRDFVIRATQHPVQVFVSTLTWLEFAYIVSSADFRRDLPETLREQFRLEAWDTEPEVRQAWLAQTLGDLQTLLSQFSEWKEVPITDVVRERALDLILRHQLDFQDALQLATALSVGVEHVASFYESYRLVDSIHLWNNRV